MKLSLHQLLVTTLGSTLLSNVLAAPLVIDAQSQADATLYDSYRQAGCDEHGHCLPVAIARDETHLTTTSPSRRICDADGKCHYLAIPPAERETVAKLHIRAGTSGGGDHGAPVGSGDHDGTGSGGKGSSGSSSGGDNGHGSDTGGADTEGGMSSSAGKTEGGMSSVSGGSNSNPPAVKSLPKLQQALLTKYQQELAVTADAKKQSPEIFIANYNKVQQARAANAGQADKDTSNEFGTKYMVKEDGLESSRLRDVANDFGDAYSSTTVGRSVNDKVQGERAPMIMHSLTAKDGSKAGTLWKYKNKDMTKEPLSSSEMSFHQLKDMAHDDAKNIQTWYEIDVSERGAQVMMMQINKDRGLDLHAEVHITRGDPDFAKLYGTDNVRPLGFMFADHQKFFGGKDITEIRYQLNYMEFGNDASIMPSMRLTIAKP